MQTDFLDKFLHFMLNELNDPLNLIEHIGNPKN